MITGGIRAVSSVSGPSSSTWLKRRRDGLAAQHRALDEGRIDDLVRLMQDEGEPGGEDRPTEDDESRDERLLASGSDDGSTQELAREVAALATDLEARIARVRAEALEELKEFDRRVDEARFGGHRPGTGGGRRGGSFNAYL